MARIMRDIVKIDENLCDGCGDCVPSCAEGAIRIIDGKARLVAENLCDGIGACLGSCPKGAISVEKRAVDPFDEKAVEVARPKTIPATVQKTNEDLPCASGKSPLPLTGSCPGSRVRTIKAASRPLVPHKATPQFSQLTHWPVQLTLVPPTAPFLRGAEILLAADCGPFACADFHSRFIAGKAVLVGCPKLDNLEYYREKLAAVFCQSGCSGLTIVTMEVPCCLGLKMTALQALRDARATIPVREVVIGIDGSIKHDHTLPAAVAV